MGHLGKFEDLDSFDSPFEFQSKMNPNDATIDPANLPSPDAAFGDFEGGDDDSPF